MDPCACIEILTFVEPGLTLFAVIDDIFTLRCCDAIITIKYTRCLYYNYV